MARHELLLRSSLGAAARQSLLTTLPEAATRQSLTALGEHILARSRQDLEGGPARDNAVDEEQKSQGGFFNFYSSQRSTNNDYSVEESKGS